MHAQKGSGRDAIGEQGGRSVNRRGDHIRKSLAEESGLDSAGIGELLQDFTWRRDWVRISL